MLLFGLDQAGEIGLARFGLGHPFVGELSRLDLGQNLPHLLFDFGANDAFAARQIAVLGGVRDRIAPVRDAALIEQVDDQLHLVQAFEIGHLRRVARLDQSLESGLNQRGQSAAEHRLFAEELSLSLLFESRLDDAGARPAYRPRVSQADLSGVTARVLSDGQQAWNSRAALVFAANQITGAFRRDHEHVDVGRRNDLSKVDREAMRDGQVFAGFEMRLDLGFVDARSRFVRRQHHHDVTSFGGVGYGQNFQTRRLGFGYRGTVGAQPDHDVAAAVLQVVRVAEALRAVSDHRDALAREGFRVGAFVVVDVHLKIAPEMMVGREWGVGETTHYSPFPIPYSPLPLNFLVERQLGKLFVVIFQFLRLDVRHARHRDRACADNVQNADRFEQIDEVLDLFGICRQFDHEVVFPHVYDPGAEDFDQAQDFLPLDALIRVDGQHDHLALDMRAGGQVRDLDHPDHLARLLKYLLDHVVVAVRGQRHPRDAVFERGRHAERVDLIAARAEQARDPSQHSVFILDE